MKKVLLTGGTGFIGKNILPILREKYQIDAPTRQELDLKDSVSVAEYVKNGKYDVIIQGANPNPVKNAEHDKADTMFEDSMRIFMNFYNVRDYCGKLLYFGSGAEFDKMRDICKVKEKDVNESIPKDTYGLAKFYMNELARKSENVYNLRIFGCYGPYDHESKFLTHVIRCCLKGEDITIRQNCYFDYMQVFDLAKAIECLIEGFPLYHDYNVCSGVSISLKEIANKICEHMACTNKILIMSDGLNHEYTADNTLFMKEFGNKFKITSMDDGIELQIAHEKRILANVCK